MSAHFFRERKMPKLLRWVFAFALAFAAGAVMAQEWPARPVRFIVPWPVGGLNDLIARVYNDQVSKTLGQTVVTDFKPGAGGRIGVSEIAHATPDGYTIGMGNLGPLTIYPHLYKSMAYDVKKDIVPIAMFAASPQVLVTTNSLPVTNVKELIALARAQPGKLNYASVGIGTLQQLAFQLILNKTPADIVHVPYKGTSESLPNLIGGQVQAMIDTLPVLLAQIKAGKIRALAVTTPQRVPQLPDVPTLAESGYPEIDAMSWYAVIVPAGTPKPIVDRLYKEYTAAAHAPEVQKFLAEQGLVYLANTQSQFAARIEAESARWGQIIREQNIKVE
jgi:tripartite-type tricarboxylate transporter receptor subunit TctC